jgi:hypothetical protein
MPAGTATFQAAGSTYTVIQTSGDWLSSQRACRQLGMDLATVSSAAIFTEVHSQAARLAVTTYWIGGSDQHNDASDGVWRWPSGWAFWPGGYANWNTGEPNGGTVENCVEVITPGTDDGRWNDVSCTVLRPALCGFNIGT